ncbi:MAG: succinylglutamate desuccinylase/aspartoacylase family protein [Bryobacteraceae bacterium]|nr:succinylglutamate desuccinylase/aspartoacylase family protein [Bryobacterales bacterium]MEB2363557.1 succinylglutamate desuccinylase/aspartoacylase family protein [Bryobacterales bacterium]NUN00273.1 succinylglutamate desuccinylase/aspartoacylase family protein [Bryobacteraceae bacterium]
MHPGSFHLEDFPRSARHSLEFQFTAGGQEIGFPVLMVRGDESGPLLLVSAGVHGDEYEGIRAILEIFSELSPANMKGDFVAVPALNTPAVWNCTRTSPLDGANLARVFPGRADGSPTEAIAWHFGQTLLPLADLYADLHSAGVACEMPLLVGYDATDARSRDAAFAFGAPVIWAHPNVPPGRTVSEAKARNVPSIYTEARGAGRIHRDDLSIYKQGLRNLLAHMGITSGSPRAAPSPLHLLGDGDIDQSIPAGHRGFLIPHVSILDAVEKGQKLGDLVDLTGNVLETYTAPVGGRVVLIHACPRVLPGEPVFLLAGVHP